MANEITTLPVRSDSGAGAIGITKENKRAVTLPTKELDALLYNNLADFNVKVGGAVGKGDGTTARSLERRMQFVHGGPAPLTADDLIAESFSYSEVAPGVFAKSFTLENNRITNYDFGNVASPYEGDPVQVWVLSLPEGAEGDEVVLIQKPGGAAPATFENPDCLFYLRAGSEEENQPIDGENDLILFNYMQSTLASVRMAFRWAFYDGGWHTMRAEPMGSATWIGKGVDVSGIPVIPESSDVDGLVFQIQSGYAQFLPAPSAPNPFRGNYFADDTLNANQQMWLRVGVGASLLLTLPATTVTGLEYKERIMIVQPDGVETTKLVRPAPFVSINGSAADWFFPTPSEITIYKIIEYSNAWQVYKIGTLEVAGP